MPDVGLNAGRDRRTLVIGAGLSGLVAAKVFASSGRQVVVIEKATEIGGLWAPSKSYPGVRTQTPRDLYCFSDFPMPADYPEWPTGEQVYRYLCNYAERFDLLRHVSFGTELRLLSRGGGEAAWRASLLDAAGEREELFDEVVVCTGQFNRPKALDLPGSDAFQAEGGVLVHSSAFQDDSVAIGRDVVVLGYSKSATDIAMQALAAGARSVAMVFREPTWKIPYFFGNRVNFKNILYSRASEAMFMPWAPSFAGRLARMAAAPLIWANWRALEALLEMQFKLKRKGLRPAGRIEDSIHCATSIETPGFYRAVERGRIRMVRGTLASCSPGHVVTSGGEAMPAGLVVLAIGWQQDLPFLDEPTKSALIEPDGQYRLFRMAVNPELPGLGFVGFNSSFVTTLSAELSAHWLVRWFDGTLRRTADKAAMRQSIERMLSWKRTTRPVAGGYGGLCVAPYHHAHFDELMTDMGARRKQRNPVKAHLLPINPADYAALLATAPQQFKSKETAL